MVGTSNQSVPELAIEYVGKLGISPIQYQYQWGCGEGI